LRSALVCSNDEVSSLFILHIISILQNSLHTNFQLESSHNQVCEFIKPKPLFFIFFNLSSIPCCQFERLIQHLARLIEDIGRGG
jgi:hypothetical protein